MRRILAINIIDAFCNVYVATLLPLLLLEKKLSIDSIGIVFAVMPIAYTIIRLIFALFADQLSFKPFFLLNGAASLVAYAVYFASTTPFGYAGGRFFDAVSQGAIWSVNRTAAIAERGNKTVAQASATLVEYRHFSLAIGTLAAGVIASISSISNAFLAVIVLEVIVVVIALTLPSGSKQTIALNKAASLLDWRKKDGVFKKVSFTMSVRAAAGAFALSFTLPLLLNAKSYSFVEIGLLLALLYAVQAIVIKLAKKTNTIRSVELSFAAACFAAGCILLAFFPTAPAITAIILLGVGEGASMFVWESLIAKATQGSSHPSGDIGIVHILPNFFNAIGLLAAGFVVAYAGYAASFVMAALLFAAYMLLAGNILADKQTRLTHLVAQGPPDQES